MLNTKGIRKAKGSPFGIKTSLLLTLIFVMVAVSAFGFNYAATATDTDMLYDLYSFVHGATTGAPGFSFCLIGIMSGGLFMWGNVVEPTTRLPLGLFCFLGTIMIIKADSILSTLGYVFT